MQHSTMIAAMPHVYYWTLWYIVDMTGHMTGHMTLCYQDNYTGGTALTEVHKEPPVALPHVLGHGEDAGQVVVLGRVLLLHANRDGA